MWDAIVIGNGVVGASALASLAGAGLRVLGLDRFEPPHAMGSSHGETRVTRKAYFEDPAYVPLLHRSFEQYATLEAALGRPLFQPTLGLHFGGPSHLGMRGTARAVLEHGLAHERLSASELASRFAVRPDSGDEVIVEHEAGVLAAEPMLAAFLEVAKRQGAHRMSARLVTAVEANDAGVVVHAVAPGGERERHEGARLVWATGAWGAATEVIPPPCPLVVERQVQFWFAPTDPDAFSPERFPIFIHFGEGGAFYGMPRVPRFGGLSAHAVKVCEHHGGMSTSAEELDRVVTPKDETRVRDFVSRYLPLLGETVERRVCMYTNTPDDHFVIGPHPSIPRVTVALGFSGHGFKLAPAIGQLIRDQIVDGAPPLPLFDPLRFAEDGVAKA